MLQLVYSSRNLPYHQIKSNQIGKRPEKFLRCEQGHMQAHLKRTARQNSGFRGLERRLKTSLHYLLHSTPQASMKVQRFNRSARSGSQGRKATRRRDHSIQLIVLLGKSPCTTHEIQSYSRRRNENGRPQQLRCQAGGTV